MSFSYKRGVNFSNDKADCLYSTLDGSQKSDLLLIGSMLQVPPKPHWFADLKRNKIFLINNYSRKSEKSHTEKIKIWRSRLESLIFRHCISDNHEYHCMEFQVPRSQEITQDIFKAVPVANDGFTFDAFDWLPPHVLISDWSILILCRCRQPGSACHSQKIFQNWHQKSARCGRLLLEDIINGVRRCSWSRLKIQQNVHKYWSVSWNDMICKIHTTIYSSLFFELCFQVGLRR